ncbi:hypothetical protein EQP59_09785 [Ornithobacterium rhinotracheale]|uniref:TonB C-terminal domain-containing protein n=1 Tax=Ornithobacterium rhinotracheale TaxID=28251 RepID=A0A410JUE2_ORNRH|nr:hypothetical protein [Ornithobacterium rhinotracheale]QAR31609.1 hypothetical protein EQP59_09785 [Ornithobacterium rhinotracheale]
METKKNKDANPSRLSQLFFLIGLNVVLLAVWFSFNVKANSPVELSQADEVADVFNPNLNDFVVEVEPEQKLPEPAVQEELPEPEVSMPDKLEMVEKLETPPDLKPVDEPTPPKIDLVRSNAPAPKHVDLTGIKEKINKSNREEERVLKPMSVTRVSEMAVFPGCESYRGDKRKLIACFSDKLGGEILKYLNNEFPDTNKDVVQVRLQFHVDQNGYITHVDPKYGDEVFKPEAKRALERVAEYLRRKNKLIEPAKMNNGEKVELIITQDVRLQKG